jgi:hypothetical protein
MKLANPNQILELERLLPQIRQSSQPSQARGYFTQVVKILEDIDTVSEFKFQLSIKLIGANTIQELQEPIEILKNAIEYYKEQLENTPKQSEPKPKIPQTQLQNRVDAEKQKVLSENAKLKQEEERRLKYWGNFWFACLVFFIPLVCGCYFVIALFNFKTMRLEDPTSWIDDDKFGKLEFLIIAFEAVIVGFCGWAYKKHRTNFVSWYYERQRVKIN